MARGKKRSREAEPIALPDSPSDLAAFAAGDDYFSSGAQKLKKAADNSALVNLASQHAAGYRELVDEDVVTWDELYSGRFNFNLMLYGYGCKRDLVSRFIKEELHDGAVVMVHARKRRISAKQIILAVASSVLPAQQCSKKASVDCLVATIRDASSPVYVVIHNLDAPSLRNPTDQSALARLARCPNVRLIASVEHPKSSLLHPFDELESFQFVWHHVPTFTPLLHETVTAQPILAAQRGQEVKQSAGDVLQVLTRGARAVFCTLVEALLGDLLHDEDEMTGISYEHLFRLCRERFLTSNDATLRAHLTEYKDHDLLKIKKGPDGGQLLYVPLAIADLKQLVETLKAE